MAEGMPDPAGEPGTVDTDNAAKRPAWVWWTVGGVALLVVLAVVFFMSGSTSVPDMVGMTSEDATAALTSAGLRVGAVSEVETLSAPPGVVVAQSPIAGEDVRKESTVNLAVTSVPVVTVPDLVGKSVSEANAELAIEGLRAGEVEHVFDDEVEAGQVTAQDPEAGTEVKVADSVDVTVSKGTEQGQVPNVIGLPKSDAVSTVEAAGFEVKSLKAESKSVPAGDVSKQSPEAGVVADAGSLVTLTISSGAPEPQPEPDEPAAPDDSQEPAKPDEPANPDDSDKPDEPSKPEAAAVSVPDVVGAGVLDAFTTLRGAKLKVDFEFVSSSEYLLRVASQNPEAGAEVEQGSVVTISIGLPPFLFGDAPAPTPLPAQPDGSAQETTTAP